MRKLLTLTALALVAGCATQNDKSSSLSLTATGFDALTGWEREDFSSLLPVLRQNCHRLTQLPPETPLGGAETLPYGREAGDWSAACAVIETATDTRTYLQTWFQPYVVDARAFYSGYFEPQIEASLTRGGPYQTPVYGRPQDLVRTKATNGQMVTGRWENGQFKPYYDRAQIDAGVLNGQGLEIAWLKSPVDLFFLQIQGSGRLILPDGSQIRVGYDGKNGLPYVPLGRVLVQENELASSSVSMDSIKGWLETHPDRMMAMMERNPNYVFFRRDDGSLAQGATGAFGVPLTAGRSVAIDRSVVPFATPLWVETKLPDAKGQPAPWQHLVFAQDIGTDIKGAGRADLFTGWGAFAQYVAGNLHEGGRMVILLPRPPAVSSAP
ncbi:membrane-bound lytic murein transglycosylase [Gluconobacter thailandicus F149-1 = NBRC 100600]|uniref:peptidoglycan lytic exotransglycosylase n=1 Tax=Gluconobacter thailandicus NBRC 3257 TaxID=1381097 RepID=A0ABQ0J0D5_GLUTH|nr:MltA domain-containing protein [Gluconobacter thailandicus]KXV52544.1 murein transglycosylase [Gluconobacter thailandicus]GAC87207.1 membrane-bound lytic murein transglycosylase [Gluconobacter thailandicus NBRC 3255]GAD27273.1 membrane-bound lytic murein transglycosylase [Gluconobacter thailandicus NBRC 3257]GAN94034.1 membrane-bound lytic murein transglycosylase [Gluconobacter thailandicus F149-1 = NBRC 100600]GBR60824.1 membrane-bound lytic murein transglycosylase [Gluconobacter thailandi